MTGLIHEPLLVPEVTNPHQEKLREARSLIEQGWVQGEAYREVRRGFPGFRRTHMSYCLQGALESAGIETIKSGVYSQIRAITGHGIIDFNDQPGRKKKEVLDVLDKLIEAQ